MTQRYILLPSSGLFSHEGPAAERLRLLNDAYEREADEDQIVDGVAVRVVHAHPEGPALVEMTPEGAAALDRPELPLRVAELVTYPHPQPASLDSGYRLAAAAPAASGAGGTAYVVTCLDANSHTPLAGARVIALQDRVRFIGSEARTDAEGRAALSLPAGERLERLIVQVDGAYWGGCYDDPAPRDQTLHIAPVDLRVADAVRHYYPAAKAAARFDASTGVTVGVIDSGVGPHPDLNLHGGRCTVTGQPAAQFADVGHHGTHVAGLIGARGTLPALAPGVKIKSYRVFPDARTGATNYAILHAMIRAAADECDIINLSLGGGPHENVVAEAILDARENGMLVVVAAGNDGGNVSFPAAHPGAIAVSAMGRRGTYPEQARAAGDFRAAPRSRLDRDEYIAAFSNTGPRIDMTAPGVGVLSTLPGGGYGPLSGTSMAAPVVAGIAACLLSRDRALFRQKRDRARAEAIEKLLRASCVAHGFGADFEGGGRPQP